MKIITVNASGEVGILDESSIPVHRVETDPSKILPDDHEDGDSGWCPMSGPRDPEIPNSGYGWAPKGGSRK